MQKGLVSALPKQGSGHVPEVQSTAWALGLLLPSCSPTPLSSRLRSLAKVGPFLPRALFPSAQPILLA